jgi:predicted phage terminase large subunit-like protein
MYSCCSVIENGFVYLPEKADWLTEYVNELTLFPNGKYDDQVDSTSSRSLSCGLSLDNAREPATKTETIL